MNGRIIEIGTEKELERRRHGANLDYGMDNTMNNCRVRLRVKDESMTRDKIIETVFLATEIPFVRIFGGFPVYTAVSSEKDGNRLLKPEIKNKLRQKGIEVQIPMEMKAKRTLFLRRLDRHVGEHSKEEIKAEIEKNQDWAGEVSVTKIKDYTHVLKIEFGTVEAADKALEKGILMFHMMVAPDQMARDEFISILTCFKCYALEDHATKNCKETKTMCSECAQEGHRWTECRNPNKKSPKRLKKRDL